MKECQTALREEKVKTNEKLLEDAMDIYKSVQRLAKDKLSDGQMASSVTKFPKGYFTAIYATLRKEHNMVNDKISEVKKAGGKDKYLNESLQTYRSLLEETINLLFTLKSSMNPVETAVWIEAIGIIRAIIEGIMDKSKAESILAFIGSKQIAWALLGKVVAAITIALASVGIIWWIINSNSNKKKFGIVGGLVVLAFLYGGPIACIAGVGVGALLGEQIGSWLDKA